MQTYGIDKEKIKYDEEMKNHTSFKIGGKADCYIKIDDIEELKNILKFSNKENIPLTILGNGSNVLVLDGGIEGIVLKINLDKIEIKEDGDEVEIIVGAGYKLAMLGTLCLKNSYTGFEELSGIPGTIGGAIMMNAGAHGKEMKDIVEEIYCLDYEGKNIKFTVDDAKFGYRTSALKNKKYIIVGTKIKLQKGNTEEIQNKMDEYKKYRREKQPIELPSAGSTFKRGDGFVTAKLIDDAGLKGYCIGGAEVSSKHAGFIVNKENATAEDVVKLTNYIKEKVYEKFQKKIELEIEVIGRK